MKPRSVRTRHAAVLMAGALLGGCAQAAGNTPNLQGPPVSDVESPYQQENTCFKEYLKANTSKTIRFGVVSVEDATGKYNVDRGSGRWVTQGATDMLYSAFHVQGRPQVVERSNTRVLEWEVNMANKRLLGDGAPRTVKSDKDDDGESETRQVYYRGIDEGGVMGSDYYITGSINRLDLTTNSAEAEARVAGIGPEARGFAMQVGFDLRAVHTQTGVVHHTVSMDKKIIGEVYGVGVGRIFGTTLVEFGAEVKRNEPMQAALKGMLQKAATEFLSKSYGIEVPDRCSEPVRELRNSGRNEPAA